MYTAQTTINHKLPIVSAKVKEAEIIIKEEGAFAVYEMSSSREKSRTASLGEIFPMRGASPAGG